ncbi:MAG: thioredoxin-disulfide reductase [Patescibacteria group bacterium]|nr:thioredoxin-disulfide reductase [Patescibacteria group bacterium]
MNTHKTIIIGAGPAGYTAAIYAARADLQPVLIAGREPGGQLMTTSEVENWPGDPDGVYGSELMDRMRKQAEKFGTKVVLDEVVEVDFSVNPLVVKTANEEYHAQSVIVATGASAMWLGIPGEADLKGKGVSACATCDGFFFRDKKVVVVGGGDSALEEATFLTKFASEITILVRRDEFRASAAMQKRALNNPKIKVMWHSSPTALVGTEKLEAVKIINNENGEESEIMADGFFASIGHKPNTDIFAGQLELDQKGYIVCKPDSTATSAAGVFVSGDVADPWYRQAITAAGTGCQAALEAERFLSAKE